MASGKSAMYAIDLYIHKQDFVHSHNRTSANYLKTTDGVGWIGFQYLKVNRTKFRSELHIPPSP